MTSIRYACFLIDTHIASGTTNCEALLEHTQFLVSSLLSSLRDMPSDNGERIPLKWLFQLFNSGISDLTTIQATTTPTMNHLTAASLFELSTSLKQALPTNTQSGTSTPKKSTSKASSGLTASPTTRKRRSSLNSGDSPASSFTSHLESLILSLTKFLSELEGAATVLEDRDNEPGGTSKSPGESRPASRLRKCDTLVFLLSACPSTLPEIMRSVERPNEKLRNQASAPLDPRGSLLYCNTKLKNAWEPIVKKFKSNHTTEKTTRLLWIDTREWLIPNCKTPDSTAALLDYFGDWDRGEEAIRQHEKPIGPTKMQEYAKHSRITVFSASSLFSIAQLVPPSTMAKIIGVNQSKAEKITLSPITLRLKDKKFNVIFEAISSSTFEIEGGCTYEAICTMPQKVFYENHWSTACLVVPKEANNPEIWNTLLLDLCLSSSALLLGKEHSQSLILLIPLTITFAIAVELQWKQSIYARLQSASFASQSPPSSTLQPLLDDKENVQCDERTQQQIMAKLPSKSTFDVFSVLTRSSLRRELNSSASSLSHSSERSTPKKILNFAADPPARTSKPDLLITPQAQRAGRRSQLIDSPPLVTSLDLPGHDADSESDPEEEIGFEVETPKLHEALRIYGTDLYSLYLNSCSIFTSQRYITENTSSVMPIIKMLPVPLMPWSKENLFFPPSNADSLEMGLFSQLTVLESKRILGKQQHTKWKQELVTFVETKILLSHSSLTSKYLERPTPSGTHDTKEDITSYMNDEIDAKERTSHRRKLVEYRMQLIFLLVAWIWKQQLDTPPTTTSGTTVDEPTLYKATPAQATKKLEIPTRTRNALIKLLTNIAFIFSSLSDVDFFKNYLNGVVKLLALHECAPNTTKWLEKRYDLLEPISSNSSPSKLPLDRSSSSIPSISAPPTNTEFLVNLVHSTSSIYLSESKTPPPKSARDALALLVSKTPPSMLAENQERRDNLTPSKKRTGDVELSHRKRTSKRAAESHLEAASSPKRKAL